MSKHRPISLRTTLCLAVLALYAAVAAWAEISHLRGLGRDEVPRYNQVDLAARNLPPLIQGHLLGTDNLGRDVAQRLIQGARISFQVGIVTSLIAIPIGMLLGLLGGYFGGKTDSVVVWLCATVASMPGGR